MRDSTQMERESRHVRLVWGRKRRPELGRRSTEPLGQGLETAFFQIRFPVDMQDL